jgi:hypothetical protein
MQSLIYMTILVLTMWIGSMRFRCRCWVAGRFCSCRFVSYEWSFARLIVCYYPESTSTYLYYRDVYFMLWCLNNISHSVQPAIKINCSHWQNLMMHPFISSFSWLLCIIMSFLSKISAYQSCLFLFLAETVIVPTTPYILMAYKFHGHFALILFMNHVF